MIAVFRRYQRLLCALTLLAVASSLISIGAFQALQSRAEDRGVGFQSPTGRRYTPKEVERLERFLSCETLSGNPFNDGVIRNDLIAMGAGEMLLEQSAEMQADLRAALTREQQWRPYRHPHLAHLSSEHLWELFAPKLKSAWSRYCALDPLAPTGEIFALKRELAMAQFELKSEQLQQLIAAQQAQVDPEFRDRSIANRNLHVFGYDNWGAWFGRDFIRRCAQLVILGAEAAEHMGHRLEPFEAKADLLARLAELAGNAPGQASESRGQLSSYYRYFLHNSGMSETDLLKVWERILLFRRAICAHRQRWSLDGAIPLAFERFAHRGIQIASYRFDPSLTLRDRDEWRLFELYCRAACQRLEALDWPQEFRSVEDLWRIAPELLQVQCRVSQLHITSRQLRAAIPAREVMTWLLDRDNWPALRKRVSRLVLEVPIDVEEREKALANLSEAERSSLDDFARAQLLQMRPEAARIALQGQKRECDLTVNGGGIDLPFDFIADKRAFVERIRDAISGQPAAREALLNYCEDGENHLSLQILNAGDWERLTWQQAKSKGALQALSQTVERRRAHPLQPQYAALEKTARQSASARGSEEAWSNGRQLRQLEAIRGAMMNGATGGETIPGDAPLTFHNQWQLRSDERYLERRDEEASRWPEFFNSNRTWSHIEWRSTPLGFCRKIETPSEEIEGKNIEGQILKGWSRVREEIAFDADRSAFRNWLLQQLKSLRSEGSPQL